MNHLFMRTDNIGFFLYSKICADVLEYKSEVHPTHVRPCHTFFCLRVSLSTMYLTIYMLWKKKRMALRRTEFLQMVQSWLQK